MDKGMNMLVLARRSARRVCFSLPGKFPGAACRKLWRNLTRRLDSPYCWEDFLHLMDCAQKWRKDFAAREEKQSERKAAKAAKNIQRLQRKAQRLQRKGPGHLAARNRAIDELFKAHERENERHFLEWKAWNEQATEACNG
jgi:hypothetical protein